MLGEPSTRPGSDFASVRNIENSLGGFSMVQNN